MKRGQFIFLLVLFALLVFYSEPHQKNTIYFGCTPSPPTNDSSQSQQDENESCYLKGNEDAAQAPGSYKKFTANYIYEGIKQNWELEVTGRATPNIYVPKIILGEHKLVPQFSEKNPLSEDNCEYRTFNYAREASTNTFNIPFESSEQISPTQRVCHFSITRETTTFIIEKLFGTDFPNAKISLNFPEEIIAYEGQASTETDSQTDVDILAEETIVNAGNCASGYELKGEFTDKDGKAIKHCVRKETFASGNEYIIDSYIQEFYTAEQPCHDKGEGYTQEGGSFKSDSGSIFYICVKKATTSSSNVIKDAEIRLNTDSCQSGFEKSGEIDISESGKVVLCIKKPVSTSTPSNPSAKIISQDSGIIEICPELNGKDITDLNICRDGGTYLCDVRVNAGPPEKYGFTVERDACGNVLVKEDNDGNPITNEDEDARAQEFIDNCMKNQETVTNNESEIVCGNNVLDAGEECDDGNIANGDGCDSGCRNQTQVCGNFRLEEGEECENAVAGGILINGSPLCEYYDSNYSSGNLRCTSECTINVSECRSVCQGPITQDTGRGDCTCDGMIDYLEQQNGGGAIDFNGVIENTWDIQEEHFPDDKDLLLTINSHTEDLNVESGVPKKFTIEVHLEGSKRDFPNWGGLFGAEGDKKTFLNLRERTASKLDEMLPTREVYFEGVLWGYYETTRSYWLIDSKSIDYWLDEINIPWTLDDSVWIKEDIKFTFVHINELPGGENIPGAWGTITKEDLQNGLEVYGRRMYSDKVEDYMENTFVILVEDKISFYDYNDRQKLLPDPFSSEPVYREPFSSEDSLYLPAVRGIGGENVHFTYVPVPWKIIEAEKPIEKLLRLENSEFLTKTILEGEIAVVPTHNPRLKLLKDIVQCRE